MTGPTRTEASPRPSGLHHILPRDAETVDLELDDVPGAQVRMIGEAQRDARRGSGVDEIPGTQHHELAEVPDEVVDVEDHCRRRAILANHPVHARAHS